MSASAYIAAVAYTGAIIAGAGAGALACRRRFLPAWRGSPARLAESILAIAIVVLAAELTGLLGALTKVGLLLGVAALAVAARILAGHLKSWPAATGPARPPISGWLSALALAAATIAALHWSGGVQDSLSAGIYRQDSTWYHLPLSAGFFQSGDTWSIHFTDPLALTAWFYPQNSELLHAVGMFATGNDFLSTLANLGWLGLALLAGWCVGRPYGLAPVTLIGTALILDSGMMSTQAGNAPSDTASTFFLLACVALLVNANTAGTGLWARQSTGALLVAALAAGLAIGTKVNLLAAVAALSIGLAIIAPRGSRRLVGSIWLGGLFAGGGFWYIRNLIQAGTPLPWFDFGPLPSPDQPALYPRPAHSIVDYLDEPAIWFHEFVPQLGRALGEAWPLVLLAAVIGLVSALWRKDSQLLRVLGGVGIVAAVSYVFIPISASGAEGHPSGFETNLRYLAPALALGLALLPLVISRSWVRWLAFALFTILALNAATDPGWDTDQVPAGVLFVLVAAIVSASVVVAQKRHFRSPLATGLGALAITLMLVLGYGAQRGYLSSRYVASLAPLADNPGFRATPQWRVIQEWGRDLKGERVGVVGPPAAYGQYVFYGGDLSNHVRYVGATGANGAYLPIGDCIDWFRALNEGRYGYVVVTPSAALGPGPVPQESLWMSLDPAVREIVRSGAASVFKVRGPLDPRNCDPDRLPPTIRVPGSGFAVPGLTLPPPVGE